MRSADSKILPRPRAAEKCRELKADGKTVVFTNGCFDILHAGHVKYLEFARSLGDVLVVGLNSDGSVRRLKGPGRPIIPQAHRAVALAALESVDFVAVFDEDEPRALIAELQPDVLVKAEDWAHYVSGRDVVEARGGRVVLAPLMTGLSTSEIVRRIKAQHQETTDS